MDRRLARVEHVLLGVARVRAERRVGDLEELVLIEGGGGELSHGSDRERAPRRQVGDPLLVEPDRRPLREPVRQHVRPHEAAGAAALTEIDPQLRVDPLVRVRLVERRAVGRHAPHVAIAVVAVDDEAHADGLGDPVLGADRPEQRAVRAVRQVDTDTALFDPAAHELERPAERQVPEEARGAASRDLDPLERRHRHLVPLHRAEERVVDRHAVQEDEPPVRAHAAHGEGQVRGERHPAGRERQVQARDRPHEVVHGTDRRLANRLARDHAGADRQIARRPLRPGRGHDEVLGDPLRRGLLLGLGPFGGGLGLALVRRRVGRDGLRGRRRRLGRERRSNGQEDGEERFEDHD